MQHEEAVSRISFQAFKKSLEPNMLCLAETLKTGFRTLEVFRTVHSSYDFINVLCDFVFHLFLIKCRTADQKLLCIYEKLESTR